MVSNDFPYAGGGVDGGVKLLGMVFKDSKSVLILSVTNGVYEE